MKTPSHCFYGNQPLLMEEKVAQLTQQLRSDGSQWEVLRFDIPTLLKNDDVMSSGKLEEFAMECETPSLFIPNKIIRVEHLEKLKLPPGVRIKKKAKPEDMGSSSSTHLMYRILGYLENPPSNCVFFWNAAVSRESELSSPLLKGLKASAKMWKFIQYDNDSPVAWVMQRASTKHMTLSNNVAQHLINLVGNDLEQLDQELEKLALNFSGGKLTEEHLNHSVSASKQTSVFRITESLAKKQLLPALETLESTLRDNPRDSVKIYILVYHQFRKMLMVQYLLQERAPEAKLISALKLPPFLARQVIAQAKQFQVAELENILSHMAESDLRFKFYQASSEVLLQNLFQKICLHSNQS